MKAKNFLNFLLGAALLLCIFSCGNGSNPPDADAAIPTVSNNPAIEGLTEKIKNAPNDAGLFAARGALWYDEESYDESIADLEKAIQLDSGKVEYYHALGDAYLDYSKSRKALEVMEHAGLKFPKRIPTLLKLSEFQLILQQHNPALYTLERIRMLDPQNAEMFFMFGNVFKDMGKTEQALSAWQSAVENDADLTDAWINLANAMADKGAPLAVKYFDNAIRSDTNSVDALHAKAYFLSNKKNDLNGAIALYKKINTLDPQYEEGFFNTGLLYLDLDSVEQAYKSFDLAVKVAPSYTLAYYHRGVAAELKKEFGKAKKDYEEVLRLDPDFEGAKEALARLH